MAANTKLDPYSVHPTATTITPVGMRRLHLARDSGSFVPAMKRGFSAPEFFVRTDAELTVHAYRSFADATYGQRRHKSEPPLEQVRPPLKLMNAQVSPR